MLKKRGDIWHYDFTYQGVRYRNTTLCRLKSDAQSVEDQVRRDLREGAQLGGVHKHISLEDAADLWFDARQKGLKSAATTAIRIKIMLRCFGPETLVTQIGARQITDAITLRRLEPTRQGKLPSNATVNRDLIDTTLRPILSYAATNLELPVKRIEWAKLRMQEPRERVRLFTQDEIDRWMAELPIWHRPVLAFILRYGVRLTEAFFPIDALHGDDVYVRERKNGPHMVTLLPEDAAEIRARIGRARAAKIYDTCWLRELKSGKLVPIHWRGFQSASAAALRRANINARPAHDGRHHAGTTLHRATGGNLTVVKELLGHEAIASTMRYAHTSRDDVRNALRHTYGTETKHSARNVSENNDEADKGTGT
ncbi:MAG: tyrosine-type recombinase/integrase [Brevundimonas sp.]|uniref:tyrosine-type recombinase/integrase n=1 Tax=Brevundimonas sp. TaxID=1871086 RepID=UPI002723431A|nr:tyrosine-type recombinase/integrase [Brevundimonas sp.]MDO9607268.1 tyrosine-type recombinase/integrase [Brevundimonas sp.]